MFTLAHLSDLHLGPLPRGAACRNFALKRAIGAINWRLNRHRVHDPAVAAAVAADIQAAGVNHVALTGDIVNVAARAEFPAAARWLRNFGAADWITFVPGNHDAYVRCSWEHGLGHLAAYMTGDMRVKSTCTTAQIATALPFVRLRKNVALIGLSSAVPQPLHKAAGELGRTQLDSLAVLLRDLRERGYARIVLIHHPPLPGLARPRKALADATALTGILREEGAELVLHGHNHEHMHNELASRWGTVHVLGVPSASVTRVVHHPVAAWNKYRISRQGGKWLTGVTVRSWQPDQRELRTIAEFSLSS